VSGAVIGGEGRNRPFLLCELKEIDLHLKKIQSQILRGIWQEISEANAKCSEYVQLTKDLVLFAIPLKPLKKTLKGSIDRRRSLEDYKSEIDRLYFELEIQTKKYTGHQKYRTVFNSEDYDWDKYIRHRPIHSVDFLNIILEYHRQKDNRSMLAAHGIGTGPGNVAQYLAQHLETVYASDSS
jgi:hypothetical protein